MPKPWVTIVLGGATVAVSLAAMVIGDNDYVAQAAGFIPGRFGGAAGVAGAVPAWLTPLTATLLHGSPAHLLFNIMVLAFCGRFVEPAIGALGLVILYVVGAYAAGLGQYATGPASMVPMVGASGAVSAMLAAQAILYGNPPAAGGKLLSQNALQILWLAVAWIGIQALTGIAFHGGVAIGAHIGGFLAGLLLVGPLLRWRHRGGA
jgi:membrane associated rhomboid family serine protease